MDKNALLPVNWSGVQTLSEPNAEQHIPEELEIEFLHHSELLSHADI